MTSQNAKLTVIFILLMFQPSLLFAADKNIPFGKKAFEIYKTSVEMRTAKGHHTVPTLARYLA